MPVDPFDLRDLINYFLTMEAGSLGTINLLDKLDAKDPDGRDNPAAFELRQLSKKYAAGRAEAYRDAAEKLAGILDSSDI